MKIIYTVFLSLLFPAVLLADSARFQTLFKEGEALRNAKKYKEAQKVFLESARETAITADQHSLAVLRSAQCDFWQGNYAAALPGMRKAVEMPGTTAYYKTDALFWLGDTFRMLKRSEDALKAYENAVRFAPVTLPQLKGSALLRAGEELLAQKKYSQAAELFRQGAELPGISNAQRLRAFRLRHQSSLLDKNYSQAREAACRIRDNLAFSASERKQAQKLVAESYFAAQDFVSARKELEKYQAMPDR